MGRVGKENWLEQVCERLGYSLEQSLPNFDKSQVFDIKKIFVINKMVEFFGHSNKGLYFHLKKFHLKLFYFSYFFDTKSRSSSHFPIHYK